MAARSTVRSVAGMATTSIQDHREQLLAGLPLAERRIELAGVSTAVLEGGDGPAVVLLHGPAGNATHWMRVVSELATTHRVVVPDLPGHGASFPVDEEFDAVAWLGELIAHSCPEPPSVVGYALGGAIAARFAAAHSDALAGLVLVDTLGLTDFDPAPEFGAALHAYLAEPSDATHDGLWRHCALDLDAVRAAIDWDAFRAYNVDCARDPAVLGGLMARFGGAGGPQRHRDAHRADLGPARCRHAPVGGRGGLASVTAGRCTSSTTAPTIPRSSSPPRSWARCAPRSACRRSPRRRSAARSSIAPIRATTSCAASSTAWSTVARR